MRAHCSHIRKMRKQKKRSVKAAILKIRLDDELKKRLVRVADKKSETVAHEGRKALTEYLRREEGFAQ